MRPKSVTIKFIAEQANVSFSTVAKALHDDPVINENTRKRIQKLAKELNYRPNILAKGLRNRKTKIIGVILNDLQSPFYSEIYKAIGDVLNLRGYTMLLSDSSYDKNLENKNISTMISQGVEGVIISPVSRDSSSVDALITEGVKVVFIDSLPASSDINCVYVDHKKAARIATEYLINAGHRRILLLNGPAELPSSQDFYSGFVQTLDVNGLDVDECMIKNNPISIEKTCAQISAIFSGTDKLASNDFTAIISLSDIIAIGVYESAIRLGFSIPETYSIVGYDNILATKYLNPPLTTVQQPKEQTGLYAINLLLDQIEDNQSECRQIMLDPELIVRSSVKNIRIDS